MHVTLLVVHVAFVSLAHVAVPGGALGYDYNPAGYLVPPNCKKCDAMSCPELIYCAGTKVKDNCGCCERCSSDLFQPHVPGGQGSEEDAKPAETSKLPTGNSTVDACKERQCPRFKVCTINVQGLPICTCPSQLVCDPEKRRKIKNGKTKDTTICGSDHVTYESKCHMRVANCERGKRIRRKHVGPCQTEPQTPATTETKIIATEDEPTIAAEERLHLKTLEKARRRRLRKQKLEEKKEKRRRRKKEKKMKKEKKLKKNRNKRRRMKRRNLGGYNPYSSRYDKLIGRYTKWGRSQIRKSRI